MRYVIIKKYYYYITKKQDEVLLKQHNILFFDPSLYPSQGIFLATCILFVALIFLIGYWVYEGNEILLDCTVLVFKFLNEETFFIIIFILAALFFIPTLFICVYFILKSIIAFILLIYRLLRYYFIERKLEKSIKIKKIDIAKLSSDNNRRKKKGKNR